MSNTTTSGSIPAIIVMTVLTISSSAHTRLESGDNDAAIREIKREILSLAQSYTGQGDPDGSKQKSVESLVQKLTSLSPQPPAKDRLHLLYGAWKQVWGPYDYRNDKRGVDPELGVREIYQVVFEGGYYYNVAPSYKKGDRTKEEIGLLRGVFKLDDRDDRLLRVRFTNVSSVKPRPNANPLWDLPALAESGQLKNRTSPLPGFLVRLFFGGGALREVYTDQDMRILYGSNGKDFSKEYIYVMTRAR